MSGNNLELILKKDWDYFPDYSKVQGHFVGRKDEKDKVLNWFIRREKGCFLVSGQRGVGKTALVYEALREAGQKKDEKKQITPIFISASQLVADDCVIKDNEVEHIKLDGLQDKVITNFIRRLFVEINNLKDTAPLKKHPELIEELGDLYRKAVSSQTEIKEHFQLKKGLQKENKEESEVGAKWELKEGQSAALFSSFLSVLGTVIIISPAWGNHLVNLIFGLFFIIFPQSIYAIQRKKEIKKQTERMDTSVEQLYVSDRNVGNLVHDFHSLLKKLTNVVKIIFVVDEMDKTEGKPNEAELIRAFKNLFTISDGLFVFITSQETYQSVEKSREEKGSRGVNYTLYTDRIFISRPSFFDLEKYIDEIIFDASQELLESKEYHNFRNLLCYQAKSDFFELHYKIRDYIGKYDDQDRPVLQIEGLILEEIKQANLQKVIGQIFSRNRFLESSNWYRNDELLSALYRLVDNPAETKKEIVSVPPSKIGMDLLQLRIFNASENLLDYLCRLQYIADKTLQPETKDGNIITVASFRWTGTVNDVPPKPTIALEYEKNFSDSLSKFVKTSNEIAELEAVLTGQKFDVKVDGGQPTNRNTTSFGGVDAQAIYNAKLPYLTKLKNSSSPVFVPREELDKQTIDIVSQITHLYNSVATIMMSLIRKDLNLKNYATKRLEKDSSLFSGPMTPIREGVSDKLIHDCIYKANYVHQILVVQDMPEELYTTNKNLINSNSTHHLIINLNTKGLKYNTIFNDNEDRKIHGFIDVAIHESFSNLKSIFEQIKQYDVTNYEPVKKETLLEEDVQAVV